MQQIASHITAITLLAACKESTWWVGPYPARTEALLWVPEAFNAQRTCVQRSTVQHVPRQVQCQGPMCSGHTKTNDFVTRCQRDGHWRGAGAGTIY